MCEYVESTSETTGPWVERFRTHHREGRGRVVEEYGEGGWGGELLSFGPFNADYSFVDGLPRPPSIHLGSPREDTPECL